MKLLIKSPVTVVEVSGRERACQPGDVVSVFHRQGRRLIYARLASWIEAEVFDPLWEPATSLRALRPANNKMMTAPEVNKGVRR